MHTALRKIGNSVGMIVPAAILGEIGAGAGASLDLSVEDGRIIATPLHTARREGWAAAADQIGTTEPGDGWQDFGNEDDVGLIW